MTDFKSSFALLISSLRAYLVTQEPSFRFEYAGYLKSNEQAWEQLIKDKSLLTKPQQEFFNQIEENRRQSCFKF